MTAKEYLMQVKDIDVYIKTKQIELNRLIDIAKSIQSPQLSAKVQSSNENKAMNIIDEIMDMQSEIKNEIDKLADLKKEIQRKITNVYNIKFITLLINVYINSFTLEQTAEIMEVSYETIKKWHSQALKIFREENNMI